MPSRTSRSSGALLDPYGIYGTRTANRLRASRRRRQTQNVMLVLGILALFVSAFAMLKWRRVETHSADAVIETTMGAGGVPVWAKETNGSKGALLVASRDGHLLRLDGNAANPRKTVLLDTDFPLHSPLVQNDKIFVPSEDGVLTALSWKDKKLLWRVRFDDSLTARPTAFALERKAASLPSSPIQALGQPPASASATAPVPKPAVPAQRSTRRQVVVAGSDAGLLMAIDVGSGKPLWRMRLPAPIGDGLASVAANGRARVLVPLMGGTGMRGGLWCLDGATGKVLWRFPADVRVEAIQFAQPVGDLADNRAYGASDLGAVVALNLTTGSYDAGKSNGWKNFARPLRQENGSQTVLLRAAPLLTDLPKTEQSETGASENRRDKILVVGGNDGGVRCFSARDGALLWQHDTGAPVVSLSSVRTRDRQHLILAVTRSSRLVLLDPAGGAIVRRLSANREVFTGAAVSDGDIFAVTESGTIHRFALSN